MNYKYNEDYQYDSCISRGICSINPRTSALQEVLILYLKETAYYALKLYEKGIIDAQSRNIILNTISVIISNAEFSETDFKMLTGGFNKVLPELIKRYNDFAAQNNFEPKKLQSTLKFNSKSDINKSIQLGEKEFLKRSKNLSAEIRDLFRLSFVLAKSICINILDIETFVSDMDENPKIKEGYFSILSLLNLLNNKNHQIDEIKKMMLDIAKVDNDLMKSLQNLKEERYGKIKAKEVSYTTTPGKAVLVAGSNIRELEDILEALKDTDIDVYTHDEMILANTYPKFSEYPHLKGQFGQGIENCLLDFSTFPGPIILTRHSLFNVENLYRGLLFTTDNATSKGIIPIRNKDFSEVIQSAKEARGFKNGKQCEAVSVGYDFEEIMKSIEQDIENYSGIFIIGLGAYTIEQKTYFEKLLYQIPSNILTISLSYCIERKNIYCVNACFDTFAITRFAEEVINKFSLPVTIFFPVCTRYSISQMINLSQNSRIRIYVGKCTPILLNPNMISTLQNVFSIKGMTSVKKDLEDILKE